MVSARDGPLLIGSVCNGIGACKPSSVGSWVRIDCRSSGDRIEASVRKASSCKASNDQSDFAPYSFDCRLTALIVRIERLVAAVMNSSEAMTEQCSCHLTEECSNFARVSREQNVGIVSTN